MKSELSKLEREIAQKIQEKQEAQKEQQNEQAEIAIDAGEGKNSVDNEATVISLQSKDIADNSALLKTMIYTLSPQQQEAPVIRKTKGLRV